MTKQTKKRGKLRIIFYGLLAAILLPVVSLWSFSFYVNSVELPDELRRPPKLAHLSTKADAARTTGTTRSAAVESSRPATSPETAGKPQEAPSYVDIIRQRLERGEELPAGKLYLELIERWEQDVIYQQFDERFKGQKNGEKDWRPGKGSVSDEQAEWLLEQEALLALFRRLIAAGPIPSQDLRELLSPETDFDETMNHPLPNFQMLLTFSKMLAANGRLRSQEGDATGAAEDFLALERFGDQMGEDGNLISALLGGMMRRNGYGSLRQMLEHETLSDELLGTLRKRLQAPAGLGMDHLRTGLDWEYLLCRKMLVQGLDGPWTELMRMSHLGHNPYQKGFSLWNELAADPRQTLFDAWGAIRFKRNGAEFLRTYDAWRQAANDTLHQPYALEQPKALQTYEQLLADFHFGVGPSATHSFQIRMLREQAERNLLRAGVAWLSDGAAGLENLPADFTDAPDHPWRDPFTEQPLQIHRTATHVIIYSLGPDQADQRGETEYPENTSDVIPGDILIRLPVE